MKNVKFYNIYIFISSFTRNIIDTYSVVLLYKKGFSVNDIIGIYALIFFLGIFISTMSLKIGNKIGYKYVLIFSSIITSISFYIINKYLNPYIISLFLSLSQFTYHPIKHYYGIILLNQKKQIGNTIILTYVAIILSSYITIKQINLKYLVIICLISIIPSIFVKNDKNEIISYPKNIPKNIVNFFIFDQSKIIFILLQPLYLYTISNKISYVGIFNIIITISSILFIYFIANRKNIEKHYRNINIIFTIILLLKLNIKNEIFLLMIAFLEGIGLKTNELVSTMNLYCVKNFKTGYLIISEIVFCLVRCVILCLIFILKLKLKTSLYILLVGIFILSFCYKKNTNIIK